MKQKDKLNKTLTGVKIITIVNAAAALLHLMFWTLAFIRLQSPFSDISFFEKINLATTYGFGIADLIWSFPLLIISAIFLWQLKPFGWLTAQMANVLYWYSLTVLLVRDILTNTISPGIFIFMPFVLFAFWAAIYLWNNRKKFYW
jgi:hypothetical protein